MDDQTREELTEKVRVAVAGVSEHLDKALSTCRVTNQVMREVGRMDRKEGTSRNWEELLIETVDQVAGDFQGVSNKDLDSKLIRVASLAVSWVREREQERAKIENGGKP